MRGTGWDGLARRRWPFRGSSRLFAAVWEWDGKVGNHLFDGTGWECMISGSDRAGRDRRTGRKNGRDAVVGKSVGSWVGNNGKTAGGMVGNVWLGSAFCLPPKQIRRHCPPPQLPSLPCLVYGWSGGACDFCADREHDVFFKTFFRLVLATLPPLNAGGVSTRSRNGAPSRNGCVANEWSKD